MFSLRAIHYLSSTLFYDISYWVVALTSQKAIPIMPLNSLPQAHTLDKLSLHNPPSKPPPPSNTRIYYSLFTPHEFSMPAGPLISKGWKKVMTNYPNKDLVTALLGIFKFGARIGYEGSGTQPIIYPNLPTVHANSHPSLLSSDLAVEQNMNRLKTYPNMEPLPNN